MDYYANDVQSQCLRLLFALDKLELRALTAIHLVHHSSLGVPVIRAILKCHLAELFKDLEEWFLWQFSESLNELAECRIELVWHPVQGDQGIKVNQLLHYLSLVFLGLELVPLILVDLAGKDTHIVAEELLQVFLPLIALVFNGLKCQLVWDLFKDLLRHEGAL